MKLKFIIFMFCLSMFVFNFSFRIKINAENPNDPIESNIVTNLEDFEIQDMRVVVYEQNNDYKIGYLFEGVTESFMIYDNVNNVIVLYCFDSHSPWYLYPSSFEKAGCLYLNNNVYSYVNLETTDFNMKGDIEVINQDIDIDSNPLIADLFYFNINEPNNLNFDELFNNHIIDSHIIDNAYYFERLNKNIGINDSDTCQYVAVNMLLSYYDTFYDDGLVSDEYIINTDIINRYNFDMIVESPGGGELLDAHLKDLCSGVDKENTNYYLYIDIINNYLINSNYNSTDGLTLINVTEFDYISGTNEFDDYYEVKDIIKQNFPVFLAVDPGLYFDNTTNQWIYDVPGGHAVVAYGYYLTNIEIYNNPTTTYFLTNMGFYDEFNQYKYTKMLMYNGYNSLYEGFTFIPNDNFQHQCSNSYIYTVGDCKFGLCPCDQYLNDNEFYAKYCNLIVTEGYDEFYCKEHNNLHLIYRREHEHNYDYTNINDELHNMSCLVPGCNFNAEEVHTYSHEINSTHTEHYDVCICGDVIYQTYDFYHMTDWDNSHLKICNSCGLSEIVRDYQCHAISEHYHEYYCDVCDIVITEEHKLIYEEVDDDRHIRRCIYCDYYEITFHDSWGNPLEYYWNPDKNYYDVYCILCGNHHTSNTNKEDE